MAQNTQVPISRVNFGYSFAPPHRLTVAKPNSKDKTLLDLYPGRLRISWTYEDLTPFPLFAFATPTTRWELNLIPQVDGHPFVQSTWNRFEGYLPVLVNDYWDGRGTIRIEVMGSTQATICRITVNNTGDRQHTFSLGCEKPGNWAGMNPAWVDSEAPPDVLLAGWLDRADRILAFGIGADANPITSATSFQLVWNLQAGEKRTGWIIRPYKAYVDDLPELRRIDWEEEAEQALDEWKNLLARSIRVEIPDAGVRNAFYACLADLFIMREPLADGHIVGTPGTEMYRAPNSYEAGIVAVALDQVGLTDESVLGFDLPLALQEDDGNWTEPKGWAHYMWGGSGFKSWVVMEHYLLTGDRQYLTRYYPRMVASSRWQARMRSRTRSKVINELYRGLMPRGMGDAGLKDDDDLYGVFIPHNIWAVYADKLTLRAAYILGQEQDITELETMYQNALADLLTVMERGAIQANGYRWIPGVPGKTSGSRWGVLNSLFPCQLLPPDHELIEGTLRHIESSMSPGGIPTNTGWMMDGMWVAITLDNLAEAHLARLQGDAAAEYLYAVINHGTPLYTWCEERGQEPNTDKTTGDRQHLWTPVAVVRALRDCMVFEVDDDLHLALGTPRSWLSSGATVGIENAATHFGPVTYNLTLDSNLNEIRGYVRFPERNIPKSVTLHIRLAAGFEFESVSVDKGLQPRIDQNRLIWSLPDREARFTILLKHLPLVDIKQNQGV